MNSSTPATATRLIGLTGGIGCGKSTVGKILEELGLRRLDTDQVARNVVEPGSEGLAAVVEAFGSSVLNSDGSLDRGAVGTIIFADGLKRKLLEGLLHPLIWNEIETFVSDCRREGHHAVIEVPLLFENRRQDKFDSVWVVATSSELQKARLHKRNGWSEQEIESRIASQMPLDEKVERADTVIWNIGSPAALKQTVQEAWQREIS